MPGDGPRRSVDFDPVPDRHTPRTITALAVSAACRARAATIAIATAIQESKLRNLDYGDRDSLGLFQQRPSQGWGTEEQILDPVYATNRFYDALVKVKGYESMEITKVAQEVQRSAYPEAYADHEPEGADARLGAERLLARRPAAAVSTLRRGGPRRARQRRWNRARRADASRAGRSTVGRLDGGDVARRCGPARGGRLGRVGRGADTHADVAGAMPASRGGGELGTSGPSRTPTARAPARNSRATAGAGGPTSAVAGRITLGTN